MMKDKDKNIRLLLGLYRVLETNEESDDVWTEAYRENMKTLLTALYQFLERYGAGPLSAFRMKSEAAFCSLFPNVKGRRMCMPLNPGIMTDSEILSTLGFLYQACKNDPTQDEDNVNVLTALHWAMSELAPNASDKDLFDMCENIWKAVNPVFEPPKPKEPTYPVDLKLPVSCSMVKDEDGKIDKAWLDKKGGTVYVNFRTDKGYGYRLASWLLPDSEMQTFFSAITSS